MFATTHPALYEKTCSSSNGDELRGRNKYRAMGSCSDSVKEVTGMCAESYFSCNQVTNSAYYWVAPSSATVPFFSSVEIVQAAWGASQATLETSLAQAEAAVKSVLNGVYELDKGGYGRFAAQEVMLFVERNLKRNNLAEANRLLEMADASRLSSRSLIGLIRSTARLREQLPAWGKAYVSSRKRVSNLGKNPDSLFIGLPVIHEPNETKKS